MGKAGFSATHRVELGSSMFKTYPDQFREISFSLISWIKSSLKVIDSSYTEIWKLPQQLLPRWHLVYESTQYIRIPSSLFNPLSGFSIVLLLLLEELAHHKAVSIRRLKTCHAYKRTSGPVCKNSSWLSAENHRAETDLLFQKRFSHPCQHFLKVYSYGEPTVSQNTYSNFPVLPFWSTPTV